MNDLLLLADEINCSPYPHYFEVSLLINIAMSSGIGILSVLACIIVWKSSKMSKILHQFVSKKMCLAYSDDKDNIGAESNHSETA